MYNPVMEATITTADQLYEESVKPLPPSERLKLATLILNDIAPESIVDYDDEWTDDQLKQLSDDSVNRFYHQNPDSDGLV